MSVTSRLTEVLNGRGTARSIGLGGEVGRRGLTRGPTRPALYASETRKRVPKRREDLIGDKRAELASS